MDEQKVLICSNVSIKAPVVVGAERGHFCSECPEEVWIAQSSKAIIEQGGRILCMKCWATRAEKEGLPHDPPQIRPDQMGEIFATLMEKGDMDAFDDFKKRLTKEDYQNLLAEALKRLKNADPFHRSN